MTTRETLLALSAGRPPEGSVLAGISAREWQAVYAESVRQGVAAVVWDRLRQTLADGSRDFPLGLPRGLKLNWALNAERIEAEYFRQRTALGKLARFFALHGIRVMVLKGLGLSLNYPVPEHRPCGDIDIWLFGMESGPDGDRMVNVQSRADGLLRDELNVGIDDGKHHHTVFYFDGVMVENHYDFINVHSHRSNRLIERRLQELVRENAEVVEVEGAPVYLPSADFDALFLLRHSAAHFAAENIGLRHLLDWRYFVERYADRIDWRALESFSEEMNMHRFLHCMNAICVNRLGMRRDAVPNLPRDPRLEERVLDEIMAPEFTGTLPCDAGLMRVAVFKLRRWWANRWKHRMVYREGLLSTFFVQLRSHLLKPESLRR